MFDGTRLTAVISPLRRTLLAAAREREGLPDIPDAQIEILRALPRGTVSSPGELASSLGLGRSTISNLLAAMERAGLITRRSRADDGRRVDVVASDAALAYFERFDAAAEAIIADAAAALTPAELTALTHAVPVLEHLRDVLVVQRREPASAVPTPLS